jgi:hypothetical protein
MAPPIDSNSGAGDILPAHGLTGFERSVYTCKLELDNVLLAVMSIYGTKYLIHLAERG